MDDDDFNTLSYDDPDPFAAGERQAGLYEDADAGIENLGAIVTSGRGVKRTFGLADLDSPLLDVDMTQMDWHMRMDVQPIEELKKRRQEKLDQDAIARLKRRMYEVKRRRTMPEAFDGSSAAIPASQRRKREELMTAPPMDGTPWMGLSSSDKMDRLYIRLRSIELPKNLEHLGETSEENEMARTSFATPVLRQPVSRGQMNSKPIAVLLAKANVILQEQRKQNDSEILDPEIADEGRVVDGSLWVDKYSPKTYAELISDDGINRMLLTWIKMWDECSFKRKPPSIEHLSELEQKNLELEGNMKPVRPRMRIAMLYGQPGMGKTTLASIIARQAGYNPIDVNASGDRKVDHLKGLIEGVVRSVGSVNSMQENNAKPNCLIIDEIDGAHVDTIKYLISVISDKGRHAIRRPIICICNDLYVTALRDLRPHAFLLQLPPTNPHRLAERLRTICDNEKLWLDRAALQRLTEGCFGDIRSCLNTLQMLSKQTSIQRITVSIVTDAINRQGIGRESMFDHWASVLNLTKHLDGKGIVLNERERCIRLDKMVSTCDELDRYHSGLYHNYLAKNVSLSAARRAIEAFETLDLYETRIHKTQNYEMMRYMSTITLTVHLAVASHSKRKLEFPSAEQTMREKMRKSTEVLSAVRARPEVFKYSRSAMILEIIPQAVIIVQPALKPMNESLYKAQELESIKTSVGVHLTLSSTFQLIHTHTGTNYVFQPPWNELADFPFGPEYQRPNMVNSVRQMISHRIEMARMGINGDGVQMGEKRALNANRIQPKPQKHPEYKPKFGPDGKRYAIYYKFNQGSSNAIRRNVRIFQLFPGCK
ncbi:hypothetical protein L596_007568 [Steinernema carpocapsae]|uniref:AAA+ ATPase domain-containing protein n=1 Tax=Steinernema carpocapsae TaxID=34508 RepID=A0A4V6A650_STECR|nr:hypothetical protein L596_007568 [Steinernema carpocapsae]